jgi:hypothetical protein
MTEKQNFLTMSSISPHFLLLTQSCAKVNIKSFQFHLQLFNSTPHPHSPCFLIVCDKASTFFPLADRISPHSPQAKVDPCLDRLLEYRVCVQLLLFPFYTVKTTEQDAFG